jgi:hypothetical protein
MRRAYAYATHCTRQSANIRPGQGAAIVACPPAAPSGPTSPPRARIHTPAGNDIFEYTPFVQLRCKRIGFASVRDRAHSFYSNMPVPRPCKVQVRCKRIGYASVRDRAHSFYSNMPVPRPIVPPQCTSCTSLGILKMSNNFRMFPEYCMVLLPFRLNTGTYASHVRTFR